MTWNIVYSSFINCCKEKSQAISNNLIFHFNYIWLKNFWNNKRIKCRKRVAEEYNFRNFILQWEFFAVIHRCDASREWWLHRHFYVSKIILSLSEAIIIWKIQCGKRLDRISILAESIPWRFIHSAQMNNATNIDILILKQKYGAIWFERENRVLIIFNSVLAQRKYAVRARERYLSVFSNLNLFPKKTGVVGKSKIPQKIDENYRKKCIPHLFAANFATVVL